MPQSPKEQPRSAAPPPSGLAGTVRRLPAALAVSVGGWAILRLIDTDAGRSGGYGHLFMLGFLAVVTLPWLLSPALDARRRQIRYALAAEKQAVEAGRRSPASGRFP